MAIAMGCTTTGSIATITWPVREAPRGPLPGVGAARLAAVSAAELKSSGSATKVVTAAP